jgi:ADP-heptose:LPS heptosyltransferase
LGDQLIASGLARDAWTKRGVKIAFGDGHRVIWDKHSSEIFQNNPNVVFPGNERHSKVEWIAFHKGNRGYNKQGDGRWIWNMDWRCVPGEIYLTHGEVSAGKRQGERFVVIEPNVVSWKSSAENKRWPFERYQAVADALLADGIKVMQFESPDGSPMLRNVKRIKTRTFRDAVAILKNIRRSTSGRKAGCITPPPRLELPAWCCSVDSFRRPSPVTTSTPTLSVRIISAGRLRPPHCRGCHERDQR